MLRDNQLSDELTAEGRNQMPEYTDNKQIASICYSNPSLFTLITPKSKKHDSCLNNS